MRIVGLTGSIGMGKSTAAAALRRLRIPVHDADRTVHRLMQQGGAATPLVGAAFPGTVRAGAVDRSLLAARVFGDRAALDRLEAILHPLVRDAARRFLAAAARRRVPLAVLDVPLLFETGTDRECDATIVTCAPAFLQRQRVLRRAGMSEARLAAILARQWPDRAKRLAADLVVPTGLAKRCSLRRIEAFVRVARGRPGGGWRPGAWRRNNAGDRSRHRDDGAGCPQR